MKSYSVFLLILIMLAGSGARSSHVTPEQASEVALKFYYERVQFHKSLNYSDLSIQASFTVSGKEKPLYYIFNISPAGFIAIAADDAVTPVLCYSFNGSYENDNQPENFQAWIEQYRRQLESVELINISPEPEVKSQWDYYRNTSRVNLRPFSGREVPPLLTSTWNQGIYYNELCPADPAGPGGRCYAGCVATAMGQVMNYFRWPDTGTGSYTYECPPYGTLSADFGNSTYHWDLMETSLSHSNTYVAEVLYHLGVSVDMVYGPDGSGMYNHKAAYSLRTYFKYSPETQYVFRDSTTMDWDSLLVSHLDQRIPMYYAGWSEPHIYGHAFVCDGYQGTGYYHFNWGWGGSYDGYFYTGNLTPGGSNFNLAQELIINAVPDTNQYNYPLYCSGSASYSTLYGTIDDGSGPVYPYLDLSDCSWLIAPADSVEGISLKFLNFSLETGDTLKIFEGDTLTAPLLGAFTGSGLPPDISTESNRLFLHFVSDSVQAGEGFLASYSSVLPVYCSGSVILNATSDTISDGSGPYNYHNNSLCMWRIIPENAGAVTIHFTEFETEELNDVVKIFDLSSQALLAEYSGYYPDLPEPVTATGGKMLVTFTTNHAVIAPGWTAYYETETVSIPDIESSNVLVVYPNPSCGMVTIRFSEEVQKTTRVIITDLSGRELLRREVSRMNSGSTQLDLRHLSPGIYFLNVIFDNLPVQTQKIIRY
ncbi:MAG: C10 family peptidase [Bacteroidales bacterium]|nr:C10 family peptidase [Bacteroidales bacterium]